jgi:hypothetical protein
MHEVCQILNNAPRLEAVGEEAVPSQKENQQAKVEAIVPSQEMVTEGGQ